jgi:hypothetical protein
VVETSLMIDRHPFAVQSRLPSLHGAALALLERAIESLRRGTDDQAVHTARTSCKRARVKSTVPART